MTESLLTLVREKQVEATREALDRYRKGRLPRRKRDRDRLSRELSQLIAEHVARFADDRELVRGLTEEAQDQPPGEVDRINDFLQRYLGLVLDVCNALRGLAVQLAAAGYPVEGIESLEAMIAERRRWREDLPEQLALGSRPMRSPFRDRVARALKAPPQDTDWRSLFR
jgi:hypothetical protein